MSARATGCFACWLSGACWSRIRSALSPWSTTTKRRGSSSTACLPPSSSTSKCVVLHANVDWSFSRSLSLFLCYFINCLAHQCQTTHSGPACLIAGHRSFFSLFLPLFLSFLLGSFLLTSSISKCAQCFQMLNRSRVNACLSLPFSFPHYLVLLHLSSFF